MRNMQYLRTAAWAALAGLSLTLAGCGGDFTPLAGMTIQTLSNRADLVSGGTAPNAEG